MDAAVRTTGLTKDYGGVGLFDLDLTVPTGAVLGFLGPNGAGKTTTLRLLLGFAAPDRGSAEVLGLDVQRAGRRARADLGFLPSELQLGKRVTGRRLLRHLAALRGGVDQSWVDTLCERFDVELDRPVRDLSTGNRRKVGLVQAFMHRPALLLLDEPTAGLDPLVQREFHALLRETTEQGRTVVLSSHTLSEVERVADTVAVLRRGRLVAVEGVGALRARAVRRLHARTDPAPVAAQFAVLPGVRGVEVQDAHLSLTVEGEVDQVVKELARYRVHSLDVDEGDLEETFLALYSDEVPARTVPRQAVTT